MKRIATKNLTKVSHLHVHTCISSLDKFIQVVSFPQTGTLTQNVMTFLKCSIGGVKYGDVTQDIKEKEQIVATGEFNPVQRQESGSQSSPV